LDSLSPDSVEVSPEDTRDLSTKSSNSRDNGDTGDSFDILKEEKEKVEREPEMDIDHGQTSVLIDSSNTLENIMGLPSAVTTVTTVTDSNDSSSNNNTHVKSSAPPDDGQDVGIQESDSISNNTSILNSNDGLKTIDNNYEHNLTHDNNGLNPKIKQKGSFYYCKTHPKFESIHLEVVETHLLYSKEHSQEHPDILSYYNRDMEIQSKDIVHMPT
jgi:hypothetical protein